MDGAFTGSSTGLFKTSASPVRSNDCLSSPNSSGGSALLSGSGGASVAANSLALSAEPVPVNVFGLFFYGPGGPLTHAVDYTGVTNPANLITPGSTWNFQGWFRDVSARGAGFNLSGGLQITFLP